MTNIRIKDNAVAVDYDYFWLPMSSCPRGVKLQLLNAGGVAVYGQYDGKSPFWQGWAPLPKKRKPDASAAATKTKETVC